MKLNPSSPLHKLMNTFPVAGQLQWIGVRPEPRADMVALTEAQALAERGLVGDHRARRAGSRRQVTLIQREHLDVVTALLRGGPVDPSLLRRTLLVSGINVLALKDQVFRIGGAVFEGTGPCEPCSRMEKNLGPGGYNALRGHGGITARVVASGVVCCGDEVRPLAAPPD